MITWDYDVNIATEWLRMGGCNHCGACCLVQINIPTADSIGRDCRLGGDGTDGLGVWYQYNTPNGAKLWTVEITEEPNPHDCFEALEGACVMGAGCKSLICTAWPLHPDHVDVFDDCSYRFIKLSEWAIEGQNTPPLVPPKPVKELEFIEEYVEKEIGHVM